MFHNAANMRVKMEVDKLKAEFISNQNFKRNVAAQNPELAAALASNKQAQLEKIIGDIINEQMQKQRAEKERILRLHNADPNDVEAQK